MRISSENWKSQLLVFNQAKRESFDELTGSGATSAGGAVAPRE